MNSLNLCILGMMSTTASLGLILLWDVDAGLTQIDKYLYSTEDYIKVVYVKSVCSFKIKVYLQYIYGIDF